MDPKTIQGLFNPVRMKIIFELIAKQTCTTKELQESLVDIPQASLYRHINALVKLGVIDVVSEEKKRGAFERTYQIKFDPYQQMNKKAEDGDKDAVSETFYFYIMSILGEFTNYLYKDATDLAKDGVGFRSFPMYLSEEEHQQFIKGLGELIQNFATKESRKDRRLRKFSFVYMPGEDS